MNPAFSSASRNASINGRAAPGEALFRNPTAGIAVGAEWAASGQSAAAPPIRLRKFRRLMLRNGEHERPKLHRLTSGLSTRAQYQRSHANAREQLPTATAGQILVHHFAL